MKTIAEEHLSAIDDKIAQLQDMRETLSHLVEACRGEIARYKIPKAVRFVEDAELPRSVTGKIKRQDLEARLKQERA